MTSTHLWTKFQFLPLLILLLMALFSWRMMTLPGVEAYVALVKVVLVLGLFFYVLSKQAVIPGWRVARLYLLYFLLFVLVALGSAVMSVDPVVSFLQWFKLFLRFMIAVTLLLCFIRWPYLIDATIKMTVYLGALVVAQYLLLSLLFNLNLENSLPYLVSTGDDKFSLLGDITSRLSFSGINFLRLTSFWLEPSKAAGFLFSTTFLAVWLYWNDGNKKWKKYAYFCLFGGFACLSNAGYLGLGAGVMAWAFYEYRHRSKARLKTLLIIIFSLTLISGALGGRYWSYTHNVKNPYVRALFGVQKHSLYGANVSYNNVSAGRVELAQKNLQILYTKPLGIGPQVPGQTRDGKGFSMASASAPILWLTFTGIFGLLFLLLVLFQVVKCYFSPYMQRKDLYIFCAWIALASQELSYGTWMDPFFLMLSTMFLTKVYFNWRQLGMKK